MGGASEGSGSGHGPSFRWSTPLRHIEVRSTPSPIYREGYCTVVSSRSGPGLGVGLALEDREGGALRVGDAPPGSLPLRPGYRGGGHGGAPR